MTNETNYTIHDPEYHLLLNGVTPIDPEWWFDYPEPFRYVKTGYVFYCPMCHEEKLLTYYRATHRLTCSWKCSGMLRRYKAAGLDVPEATILSIEEYFLQKAKTNP